ncbi:MAG: hypothetical protein MR291_10695 [Oscillospiraceae bacterium]|nr:hypothetical protein [Oscillospiraceae bacterium]
MKILKKNNDQNIEQLMKEVADYDEFMREVTGGVDEELSEDDLTMVTAAGNTSMSYEQFATKYLGKK